MVALILLFPKEFSLAENETGVYVKEIFVNSATEKEGILKTGNLFRIQMFKLLCSSISQFVNLPMLC